MTAALFDPTPLFTPEQAEANRLAFEQRWKNSATREEIEAERKKMAERSARNNPLRTEATRVRRERLAAEEEALTRKYAPLREARTGSNIPVGVCAAAKLLAAEQEDGRQKWSWRAIGRILGISGPTAHELVDDEYARKRNAVRAAA